MSNASLVFHWMNSFIYTTENIQLYLEEHWNEAPIFLVSDFNTVMTHYQSLRIHNFPLKCPTRF